MLRFGSLARQASTVAARRQHQQKHHCREFCGLVAAVQDVWTPSSKTASQLPPILSDPSALTKSATVLHHRGPDGMQIDFIDQAHAGMGHTRLAIVDPANRQADMPFQLRFNDGKILHLAANGEIYNHNSLYEQMKNEGWAHARHSGSDCEVIAHAYSKYGGPEAVTKLDGMFAFVVFEQNEATGEITQAFAARDPVGIKPLYYGKSIKSSSGGADEASAFLFSSELKALVGHVDPATVVAMPPGHYWTPEGGLTCYYNPDWLRKDDYAPWEDPTHVVTDDEIRQAFTKAVQKRMMSDVEYGFFLSGGVDSCIVAHDLLPLYRQERLLQGDDRPIPTFTVGMENSPDVMAARGMTEALGGSKYVDHHVRFFTPEEVFDLIPKIVYHMETYEAELIRSAIPNWLLAERAAQDVKMVLTGEGADELFAGYLYFQDAETPRQLQNELRRIYNMLGNINLHRTDRMTMAHGLEARVPFLDTEFTRLVMSVDPARKMVDRQAVQNNSRGREKTLLRELFEGPNANGHSIPRPVLWRAKAMQCEGVGQDWVSILQNRISTLVSDAEMDEAHITYPINTPHTKEELYYRRIYNEHYHGMEHVVKLWDGGGRAMGAEWKSDMYTREGLKDVNLLSHALQQNRTFSTSSTPSIGSSTGRRSFSSAASQPSVAVQAAQDACSSAIASGYSEFEAVLTSGVDDRSLINEETGTNKYHIRPQPIDPSFVFRGSCTGNPPTANGYNAAKKLYDSKLAGLDEEQTDAALREIFADQRRRIAQNLDLPTGTNVVICPSGSDAEYIPLAIARALKPDATITNGVTQVQEIGAGSAPAAIGEYFSTHTPLTGLLDEGLKNLAGFEGIGGVALPARERNGTVIDAAKAMADFTEDALSKGEYPIAHGVWGGKTGLRDDSMPPSIGAGDKSLGVVDACQGRFSSEELKGWLAQDSIVLFTGSKFFQGPPFCGAVLIPPAISKKLEVAPAPEGMLSEDGLGAFLTDKEVPACLQNWVPSLSKEHTNNVGLALRWEAGLAGMEAFALIPEETRSQIVDEWATCVVDMVNGESMLDAWCLERSIVSIRVAKSDGGWRSMQELRDLYRWMSMDVSDLVPNATAEEKVVLSSPAFIGQPVDVSETHAIVRIALGVNSFLSYVADKDVTLDEDNRTVLKLAAIAKHFETLKESGR